LQRCEGISFESLGGLDYMHPFTQLREDGTQKKRIGAIADVSGTVRQFESFLTDASIQFPVKPVAIYYSRADLHLTKLMEPARILRFCAEEATMSAGLRQARLQTASSRMCRA
jgi:hypothetical protein